MRARGLKIEAPVPARAFHLGKEQVAVQPRAFLSLPDLDGDLELLLTCTDAEGSCVLGTILSGDGKVREARHAHMARGELRDLWKQAEARDDLQEIAFTAGLHFADAWLGNQHHDYRHFLEHVPGTLLALARSEDPMRTARAPIDEEDSGLDAWLAPVSLLDTSALTQGTERTSVVLRSDTADAAAGVMESLEASVTETAAGAVTEDNRERLARAADIAAVAYTLHGRVRSAERLRGAGEALRAGTSGDAVEAVRNTVRLSLLSAAARGFEAPAAE
jgi:hypothetical protein